eukprot:1162080-Pelagomonas_calceolata.AAC.7
MKGYPLQLLVPHAGVHAELLMCPVYMTAANLTDLQHCSSAPQHTLKMSTKGTLNLWQITLEAHPGIALQHTASHLKTVQPHTGHCTTAHCSTQRGVAAHITPHSVHCFVPYSCGSTQAIALQQTTLHLRAVLPWHCTAADCTTQGNALHHTLELCSPPWHPTAAHCSLKASNLHSWPRLLVHSTVPQSCAVHPGHCTAADSGRVDHRHLGLQRPRAAMAVLLDVQGLAAATNCGDGLQLQHG